MVRRFILNDRQRKDIEEYLEEPSIEAPQRVKQARWMMNKRKEDGSLLVDLDQMQQDIDLLKALKKFEVPIGRGKPEGWVDQKALFFVRQKGSGELKAKVEVRREKK